MIFRKPPRLANWLLEHLGYARRNAALAGDLLEEFRNGRSSAWYWRQTFIVMWHAIAGNAIAMQPYLMIVAASYTIQFAVTLLLWSSRAPQMIHASVWAKVGLWALMQLAGWLVCAAPKRLVTGNPTANLVQMFRTVEVGPPRSNILVLASYESFFIGLLSYCLCALLFRPFSLAELVCSETAWFALWVLGPAILPAMAAAPAADEASRPCTEYCSQDFGLNVKLSDGRTVLLKPETAIETAFEAADEKLIAVLFRNNSSREYLRRAIWRGVVRVDQEFGHLAATLTISELASLLKEPRTHNPISST